MTIPRASETARQQSAASRAHSNAYTVSPNQGMDRLGIRYRYRF